MQHLERDMILNGTKKPKKQRGLWSVHHVDQGFWHGSRNASRGNAPLRPHVGAALRYAGHSVADFINGVGLYVQGDGMWALACPIRQQVIGYAPPGEAVGYRNAAALKGVTLEVWQ